MIYMYFQDKETLINYCRHRKNSVKKLSEDINPKDIDREIMKIFINKSGEGLKYLIKIKGIDYLDYDLCKESVLKNSFSIKFVPDCFLDDDIIKLAIEDNIYCIRHLRKKYHTEKFHKWLIDASLNGEIFERERNRKGYVFTVLEYFKNVTYKTVKYYLETFLKNPKYVRDYNGSSGYQISSVEKLMMSLDEEIDIEILLMYIEFDTRFMERYYSQMPIELFQRVNWNINDINKAILMLQMSNFHHKDALEYLRKERSRLENDSSR